MTYQQENDILLKSVLNKRFFDNMKTDDTVEVLELIVTPECNLKCEYCYLYKHKYELYPKNAINHKTIINNLYNFMMFLYKNKYKVKTLDFFSGEIWHTDFGVEVLSTVYEFMKNTYKFADRITIPTNASFIMYDKYRYEIGKLIDDFDSIGCHLHFSFSVDGAVIEDKTRPLANDSSSRVKNFYELAFDFAKKYDCGFHPMVSPNAIQYWKENYQWWEKMFDENDYDIDSLMMLEVRDDDWDSKKIDIYLDFLNYVLTQFTSDSRKSLEDRVKIAFGLKRNSNYTNISLFRVRYGFTCSVQRSLCIRLGDMAIVPCHRTSYDKFVAGYLIINNDYTYDVKSNNVEIFTEIMAGNPEYIQFKCNKCLYSRYCIKGCLGAQYEKNKELFYPCSSVCELLKSKINFLVKRYDELGYFDILEKMLNDNKLSRSQSKETVEILEFKKDVLTFLEEKNG